MFKFRLRFVCLILAVLSLLALPASVVAQTAHFSNAQISWGNIDFPAGVAVDAKGNIFFADADSMAVVEIPAGCRFDVTLQTSCYKSFTGFSSPAGVAVDASGNVFVANQASNQVQEMLAVDGSLPAKPTVNTLGGGFSFSQAFGLTLDASGNLFVVGPGSSSLYEILAAGGYSTVKTITSKLSNSPHGVAVDADENIFVAGWSNLEVTEYLASESYATAHIVGGGFNFNYPSGVALDSNGNLYIIDYMNNSNPGANAVFETTKSSGYNANNVLSVAFNNAYGIAVDAYNNVFVGDSGNNIAAITGIFYSVTDVINITGQTKLCIPLYCWGLPKSSN